PPPPPPSPFPYTTLFRSPARRPRAAAATDTAPARDPRPDRRRPLDVRDGDEPDDLHRDGAQSPAERVQGAGRAHATRGDREGSSDRKSTRLNSSHVASSY